MGFYGMLIAVILLSILALYARELEILQEINEAAYAIDTYANIQSINSFYAIAYFTMPSNTIQVGNWLNALKACAMQDSINIYIRNNTIVMSGERSPKFIRILSMQK
ncbi:MAG: hypothetical protein ACP5TL_01615 [Candidatus Micrarchaeia archaeon]